MKDYVIKYFKIRSRDSEWWCFLLQAGVQLGRSGILPAAAQLDCFSPQELTAFRCCFPMELEFLFLIYLSYVSWGSFNLCNSYSYFFQEGVLKMSLTIRGAKPVLQRRQTFPELPGCWVLASECSLVFPTAFCRLSKHVLRSVKDGQGLKSLSP